MKSLTKRISIIILSTCLLFINIFSSYKVTFAAALPDPVAIEETFRLIQGGLQNITYNIGGDPWSLGNLISAGVVPEYSQQIKGNDNFLSELLSPNNGTQNIAWEKLKNVAVVEPAKLVKYIMWDKPQEYLPTDDDVKNALKQIADKTGSAVTLVGSKIYNDTNEEINATAEALAESYLYVNDGFIETLKEAAASHVKGNKYYQNISDIPMFEYAGGIVSGAEAQYYYDGYYDNSHLIYKINSSNWGSYSRVCIVYDTGTYMIYCTPGYSPSNATLQLSTDGNWHGTNITSFNSNGRYHDVKFYTNLPIFNSYADKNNYLRDGNFSQAVNVPECEKEKIVVPLQYPQTFPGVVSANPYAFQDYISYVQQMQDALNQVIGNLKTNPDGKIIEMPYTNTNPLELPYQLPDGSPVNSPVSSPVTTPVTIPEIISPVKIMPTPSDDTGTNHADDGNTTTDPNIDDIDFDGDNGDPLLDLSKFFPFCLPHDFMTAIKLLATDGEPPVFEIPLRYNVLGNPVEHTVIIDIMKPGTTRDNTNAIAFVKYLKWFQTIAFITALIFITIKITPH